MSGSAEALVRDFRALVDRVILDAVASQRSAVFENSGEAHARVVLDAILRRAHTTVDIYSEELHQAAFDPKQIRGFLLRNANGQVRILVDRPDVLKSQNSALAQLSDIIHDNRIELKLAPQKKAHLAVVDSLFARLEYDHDNRRALVAFNQKDLIDRARRAFGLLWNRGTTIEKPDSSKTKH